MLPNDPFDVLSFQIYVHEVTIRNCQWIFEITAKNTYHFNRKKMVGLWSPDPPPEPENLEENNAGYFVVTASDDEHEDEGYEGYEPLSDVDDDDNEDDGNDYENVDEELNPQFTNASASDCDTCDRTRSSDVARSAANCREFCKYLLPAPEENVDETECASGSSMGYNTQESYDGIQAGPSSSRLEMGEQQVADVMAAMANVTLPPSAVPQWATVVPEDQWIQHILARVKLLQNKKISDKTTLMLPNMRQEERTV